MPDDLLLLFGKILFLLQLLSHGTLGFLIERDSIRRIEIGTRFVPDYELPIFPKVLDISVNWLLGLQRKKLLLNDLHSRGAFVLD